MSSDTVDLSASKDYCYSEYSYYLYTNTNLVNAAVSYLNISTDISDKFSLPFIHNPYENEEIESDTAAESIVLNNIVPA